jgi:hypothetical protein
MLLLWYKAKSAVKLEFANSTSVAARHWHSTSDAATMLYFGYGLSRIFKIRLQHRLPS